jgi:hypothetical protein
VKYRVKGCGLIPQVGYYGKYFPSEVGHVAHHPGEEKNHGHHDGDDFGYEGESSFVNRRNRLENTDNQTHNQTEDENRSGKEQYRLKAPASQLRYQFWGHVEILFFGIQ